MELADIIAPDNDGIVTQEEFFSVIHKSRKWIVNHPQFLSLYFSMVSQPAVFNLFKAEIFEKLAPYMEKLAAFFQEEGFKDSYAEVRFFLAMLDGIAIHYAMDSKNFPIDKIEEKIIGYYQGKMSRKISS